MLKKQKTNIIGQLLLFFATIIWGSSFFILKDTIEDVPMFYVLAIRFGLSALLLIVIFFKKFIKIDKKTFLHGALLGIILTIAYAVQTLGLSFTTPSRNAFLTASYVVLVPFAFWLFYKKRPKYYNIISAVLCLAGIGFVSFGSAGNEIGKNLLLGDAFTLLGGVFYCLQIIFIEKFNENGDSTTNLLTIELLTVGILCALFSIILELPSKGLQAYKLNENQILNILYLTFVCTFIAQMCQIFGQKLATNANQSSLILSLEAVFGTLFSVILDDEILSVSLIIGFIIIFIAMLISELKIDFVKMFSKKKNI